MRVCVRACVRVCLMVFALFQLVFVFSTLLSLAGNLGKAQQPQEQRYPFLSVCVQYIFLCPDNGVAASVWDFQSAHRVLMYAIAIAVQTPSESLHWKSP